MRSVTSFNDGWLFDGKSVTLPHTAVELPFSYFDETSYQRVFTYEKTFAADPAWAGQDVVLVFDGVMANAVVRLNGEEIAAHKDGYTPFDVRLSGKLRPGENTLLVRIDGAENPDIPPFGGRIDYLTYAGIYRDVWLRLAPPVSIGSVKIETPDALANRKSVRARVEVSNPGNEPISGSLTATLRDGDGRTLATTTVAAAARVLVEFDGLAGIALWDLATPNLYSLELSLGDDKLTTRFGFRTAEFTADGFKLNGRPLKIRGLNRHQSFPYAGYALGRAAQERDAEILKHQLHVNLVRTSHYPQSPWFLDHCDRIGLLVLEELPGWQHIGGAAWKAQAVDNVRAMIRRDWNHPAIVLWGVRINESADDHDFYAETNRVAHELDTTRQTGGIRNFAESELLEDVYTMNDFILGEEEEFGNNRPRTPLRPPRETTGLERPVPYMVTEFNGHMFPTKIFDQEQRQAEHVRRHLEVLNAAYGDPRISGAIGWCAFDYNTHADFGSGDRICHHGVMDMFREPKFAAYVYASQCEPDEEVILKPVTNWTRGDRNIAGMMPLIILTNCDEVEWVHGNRPPRRFTPDREGFPHLPHPPVVLDHRNLAPDELEPWGREWTDGTFIGYVDGKPARQVRFVADPVATHLEVVADDDVVPAHDSIRVMVRALDQAGNKLPFLMDPIEIEVTGAAERLGPALVPLRGGATGFWVRSTGAAGPVTVKVRSPRFGETTIMLRAEQGER
jgi:beta-galactosidase